MMKSGIKGQAGFTLVELIIVIVILGILAVTAAPRFLNLQGDAHASTLQGVQGSLESAMRILNGKAIIRGNQNDDFDAATPPVIESVLLHNGYPAGTFEAFSAALDVNFADVTADATNTGTADFNLEDGDDETTAVTIYPNGYTNADNCTLTYTPAADNGVPTVVLTTTGC